LVDTNKCMIPKEVLEKILPPSSHYFSINLECHAS
jgi:hypothetical protein